MAGEWISVDCCLPSKPEALMIMAATGQPPDVVVGRLTIFWGWVQLNAVDGVINGTPEVLAIVAGGDAAFWLAVEKAGWLAFLEDGKVQISGWGERFSQAAKERLKDRRRKADGRKADRNRTHSGQVPDKTRTAGGLEKKRGEEKREEEIEKPSVSPQTKPQAVGQGQQPISWDSENGWQGITEADRQEWRTAYPAADLKAELAKSGSWLKANPKRAGKRNWRRFLVNWLAKCHEQGGTHRQPGNRPADRPPPERWLDQYQTAEYKRPRQAVAEAAAIAKACRVPD